MAHGHTRCLPRKLSAGKHRIAVLPLDASGKAGKLSKELTVTVGTTPPAASTMVLRPQSDTGVRGDGKTTHATPTIRGIAQPGRLVNVAIERGSGWRRQRRGLRTRLLPAARHGGAAEEERQKKTAVAHVVKLSVRGLPPDRDLQCLHSRSGPEHGLGGVPRVVREGQARGGELSGSTPSPECRACPNRRDCFFSEEKRKMLPRVHSQR